MISYQIAAAETMSLALKQAMHELVYRSDKTTTEIAGLQLVLIKNGQIVFEHAEGFATINPDKTKTPLTIGHKVRIASISKFVLTLAFMSLVDSGQVDLDVDVSKYLGFSLHNPNFPNRKITARHVLAHVSSIRDAGKYFLPLGENFQDFFQPSKYYDNAAHFAVAANQGPGDYFTYSNLNFGIIAGIIEKVSGMRMDVFVHKTLFNPLNLAISFNVCDFYKDNYSNLATLFRRGDGGDTWDITGPWKPQVDGNTISCFYGGPHYQRNEIPDLSALDSYQIGKNPTLFSPQGGLRASARDLAMLMQVIINNSKNGNPSANQAVISKTSIDAMLTPVWRYDESLKNGDTGKGSMTAYGLSTHIIDLKDWGLSTSSTKLYGHLGSAYGLQGQFWLNPLTGDGLVAFVTGVGSDPAKPDKTIPLYAIEESVLRLALKGLTMQRNHN